ncbi:MAG TPA: hypothetical protein VHE60_08735 [Pyrinomonadaceae bacterium]|nr:hypothetical protein [Pyrinomonadaceae bacterium]
MDKAQRTVDSLKLLSDWSKWLISLDNRLHKPLAEADLQAIAVNFHVYRLDDVLGFDHHRGDSLGLYLRFCPSRDFGDD